jgi:hypothetical protein
MRFTELFTKSFTERNGIQRFLSRKFLFEPMEALGFHLVGDHFYEPIPNLKEIMRSYDENKFRLPSGQTFLFDERAEAFEFLLGSLVDECKKNLDRASFTINPYFRYQDAVTLYCTLRNEKIRTVVEIGQGYSTLVALAALRVNRQSGYSTRFISIDPFDRLVCQGNAAIVNAAEVTLERTRVQDIKPTELCSQLGEASLLFVDSSHIFKPGSDVEFLFREVFPRIPVGTLIHVHDVYTPYPTPTARFTKDKLFFSEQDHLESFLDFNSAFQIHIPVFWLFRNRPSLRSKLKAAGFPEDLPGNSFYLKRVK